MPEKIKIDIFNHMEKWVDINSKGQIATSSAQIFAMIFDLITQINDKILVEDQLKVKDGSVINAK